VEEKTKVDPIRVYEVLARIYARRENCRIRLKLVNPEDGTETTITAD